MYSSVRAAMSSSRGSTRCRHPTNGRAIRRSLAGPLDLTRSAPVEAACSRLPAVFQKENTILTDGVSFVTGCRFCCPHPYTSQGRGSVRGKPLRVSPLAFSHPPAGDHFCVAKVLLQKETPSRRMVFLFGAGYGSRTRLNGLGSRCNTDIPTLRFTYRVIVAYRRRFCNRKLCRKGMNALSRRIPIEKSLEGTL